MLVLKNLNMGYNEILFKDTDFHASFNEITLIKGESGIGKSTLLEIINGQLGKCWDEYFIEDSCVTTEDKDLFMKNTFYLKQNEKLFLDYSVEDNLTIFASARGIELSNEKIEWGLKEVNIPQEKRELKLSKLSSGERQRVQLAIALTCDYDILLCDELTNALDEENKIMVLNILKRLAHHFKKMVIVASHDSVFIDEVDKVYTIQNKKLVVLRESDHSPQVCTLKVNKKENIKDFYKHYLSIKKRQYRINYIGYLSLIVAIVMLTVFGFQNGTQYSAQLSAFQNSVNKDQFYLMNQAADSAILEPRYSSFNPPVSEDIVEILEKEETVRELKPFVYCSLYDENNGISEVSMKLNHLGESKEILSETNIVRQTLLPYYSLKDMKNKCEQFIGDKEGIIITKDTAELLEIEELDEHYTLKMDAYIPTTMEMVGGTKQTLTGGNVNVDVFQTHYTIK